MPIEKTEIVQRAILVVRVQQARKDWNPSTFEEFIKRLGIEKMPKKVLKEDVVKGIKEIQEWFGLSEEKAEDLIKLDITLGKIIEKIEKGKIFLELL